MKKDDKKQVDTSSLDDGKFWLVVERDLKSGKDGLSVSAVSDKEYASMVADFDIEKLGSEILMAHRC